jgi:hypothetical protein
MGWVYNKMTRSGVLQVWRTNVNLVCVHEILSTEGRSLQRWALNVLNCYRSLISERAQVIACGLAPNEGCSGSFSVSTSRLHVLSYLTSYHCNRV